MNSDNPYAAPQTLQPLANSSVTLPMAEERPDRLGRVLFPELNTLVLNRITRASRAVMRMTILWTMAIALLIVALIAVTISARIFGPEWLLLTGAVSLLVLRVYAGGKRDQSLRYITLLVDLAPCLIIIRTIHGLLEEWPSDSSYPLYWPFILLLLLILYFPLTSVLAQLKHFRVLGDERFIHDNLSAELAHRRKNRIS